MKAFRKAIVRLGGVLALVAIFAVLVPRVHSQSSFFSGNRPQTAAVIAHLSLPGSPASQMFIRQQLGKQYLYLEQGSKELTIVDVTKADQPKLIKEVAMANKTAIGRVQMIGAGIALTEIPAGNHLDVVEPTPQTVRVLDLNDPENPKTIERFSNVSSILPDESRDLIYIANDQGLWVVRHRRERAMPAEKPCTSESAFSEMANCY